MLYADAIVGISKTQAYWICTLMILISKKMGYIWSRKWNHCICALYERRSSGKRCCDSVWTLKGLQTWLTLSGNTPTLTTAYCRKFSESTQSQNDKYLLIVCDAERPMHRARA